MIKTGSWFVATEGHARPGAVYTATEDVQDYGGAAVGPFVIASRRAWDGAQWCEVDGTSPEPVRVTEIDKHWKTDRALSIRADRFELTIEAYCEEAQTARAAAEGVP